MCKLLRHEKETKYREARFDVPKGYKQVTGEMLFAFTAANAKSRFEMLWEVDRAGKLARFLAIRASQGHSAPAVNAGEISTLITANGTGRAAPPRELLHGTSLLAIRKILLSKEGLIPGGPNHRRNETCFAEYPQGHAKCTAGMRFESEVTAHYDVPAVLEALPSIMRTPAGALIRMELQQQLAYTR